MRKQACNNVHLAAPLGALLLVATQPAPAQPDSWSDARPVTVVLSNFRYEPSVITLDRGVAYAVRLENRSSGGHDFVAKDFFAEAQIAPGDRAATRGGRVALAGRESAVIRLIATQPGEYRVHCSHFLHSGFGMTGTVIVR